MMEQHQEQQHQEQDQEQQHQAMNDEQAADLAALQAGAAEEINAGQVATNQAAAQAADAEKLAKQENAERIADELTGLVLSFVNIAGPMLPSLPKIYTPATTQAAAQSVALVCVKHGWLKEGITKGHGEEVAAAMILLPLGFATYKGLKADIEAMKPKKEAGDMAPDQFSAAPHQGEGPGAKTVTIGAPTDGADNGG